MMRGYRRHVFWLAGVLACSWCAVTLGQTKPVTKGEPKLQHVQSLEREELTGVVRANPSADGKFIYASAFRAMAVLVFAREAKAGRLEYRQSFTSEEHLRGVTDLCLSPDGRYAAAVAFDSQTVLLFQRDSISGQLRLVDIVRNDDNNGLKMTYPIAATFSPDSRFVYVVDDVGPDKDEPTGSLNTFEVTKAGKLQWVVTDIGQGDCFLGAREVTVSPSGKTVFVACRVGTVVVLGRNARSGQLRIRQVVRDEEGDVHGLDGAMSVTVSPDERFVYVSAGRFEGDDAVSVFRLEKDGSLRFVQEMRNGAGELRDFEGGNQIKVAPDGKYVYAAATRSGSLACFARDATTGKLRFLETLMDSDSTKLAGAAGVGISPGSRFIYVAAEEKKAISVFRRD